MDPRFAVTREDLNSIHMDLKHLQHAHNNHAERILRLERRQADDAAIKAAWSPFPGVLASTPQHGPVSMAPNDDDLDDFGTHLMSSLHLPPAEEEPVRRGATSRANSVRFDESALHGSSWGGQNSRHSGEFVRPGSGLLMERSFSHKSDGRHSSAGHSVHSLHSAPSVGRASSVGGDAESPLSIPEPPPGLFALGSVPSIIRCWLTTKFAHDMLLYADVCTGSRRSTVEYSLIKSLDLADDAETGYDGITRITLPVYLAEAIVAQQATRSQSPSHEIHIPSMTVTFEIVGRDQPGSTDAKKGVRIFIGSDALRAHSADVLLSRNQIVLYGNDRSKLTVPFVRPEDENAFKNICTVNLHPEKLRLNAAAAPFVSGDQKTPSHDETGDDLDGSVAEDLRKDLDVELNHHAISPTTSVPPATANNRLVSAMHRGDDEVDVSEKDLPKKSDASDTSGRDAPTSNGTDAQATEPRRETASGIWGSWRQGAANGAEAGQREGGPLSGYQPAGTRGRNMKVLKPLKSSSSSSARTGASYEPPPPPRGSGEQRRKSQQGLAGTGLGEIGSGASSSGGTIRWETKRAASVASAGDAKSPVTSLLQPGQQQSREARGSQSLPRSANPIGGASAFSWMKKPGAE
ncbi:hypothetical protein jhhlp_001201 [Lomentospora prolificans]|uniref:Ubiquitin carboxyl-terminal hydrolase 19 n=1 Tax=Lomentospora prolificans TaxID=41688 RepID=A0A2N3NHL3_9PEZI|nr:hypothetical protein jhhlp_001201 [Lomentospora prolificans]